MMRRLSLVGLMGFAILIVSGCYVSFGGRMVRGTGEVITLEQDFTDFDTLSISHTFHVYVKEGDSYAVVLHVDKAVEPYLDVRQEGDTVYIGLESLVSLRNTVTLEAEVTMPRLRALSVSGASRAELDKFDTSDDMTLTASGASRIRGNLTVGRLRLELSGASEADLTGSADDLRVQASGASHAKLSELPVGDADVRVSGASSATVDVSGTLDVDASGASNVYYLGSPRMGVINTSGASNVRRR